MNSRLAALSAAALLASCGFDVPSSVENGVAVVTQRQPAANFNDYVTFSVNVRRSSWWTTGSVSETFTVDGANIVSTISSNMRARTTPRSRGEETPRRQTSISR